jgi:hypothetical protein
LKVGAEDRNKLIAAIALGVLAIILMVRFIPSVAGSSTTTEVKAPPAPAPVRKPQPVRRTRNKPGSRNVLPPTEQSLDPMLRFDWLKASEETQYAGSGRNIFRAEDIVIPRPIVKLRPQPKPGPSLPPPPPPPPPINLKFFGFASKAGEPKKIFLSEGDDIFIAGEGEIVNRRYKVLRITPTAVEIEDVLNSNRQMIPLIQG